MPLFGSNNNANSSPIFGPSTVNKSNTPANRTALYENANTGQFISGATIGVFGYPAANTPAGAMPGWVKKTTGTGGRSGRVTYEVLVASSTVKPKA